MGDGGRWYLYRLRNSDSALTGGGSGWRGVPKTFSVNVCAEGLHRYIYRYLESLFAFDGEGSLNRSMCVRRASNPFKITGTGSPFQLDGEEVWLSPIRAIEASLTRLLGQEETRRSSAITAARKP